ncbi:MAG: cysteine-rich CWC family protein [Alistipes sp.]|nr:cysteine-rich CWC family protein [Alistipes sp.]
MKKICPRCGASFDCMHDQDMSRCHCSSVTLTSNQRDKIKALYNDCLCRRCLLHYSEE